MKIKIICFSLLLVYFLSSCNKNESSSSVINQENNHLTDTLSKQLKNDIVVYDTLIFIPSNKKYNKDIYLAIQDGKWGILDKNKQVIVPCSYDYIYEGYEDDFDNLKDIKIDIKSISNPSLFIKDNDIPVWINLDKGILKDTDTLKVPHHDNIFQLVKGLYGIYDSHNHIILPAISSSLPLEINNGEWLITIYNNMALFNEKTGIKINLDEQDKLTIDLYIYSKNEDLVIDQRTLKSTNSIPIINHFLDSLPLNYEIQEYHSSINNPSYLKLRYLFCEECQNSIEEEIEFFSLELNYSPIKDGYSITSLGNNFYEFGAHSFGGRVLYGIQYNFSFFQFKDGIFKFFSLNDLFTDLDSSDKTMATYYHTKNILSDEEKEGTLLADSEEEFDDKNLFDVPCYIDSLGLNFIHQSYNGPVIITIPWNEIQHELTNLGQQVSKIDYNASSFKENDYYPF